MADWMNECRPSITSAVSISVAAVTEPLPRVCTDVLPQADGAGLECVEGDPGPIRWCLVGALAPDCLMRSSRTHTLRGVKHLDDVNQVIHRRAPLLIGW